MIPGIALVVAAVLAWLSVADRVSPLALQIVEWEVVVGAPLWPFALVLGATFFLGMLRPRKGTKQSQSEPRERQRKLPPPEPLGDGWRPKLDARARALPIEPQGRIKIDEVVGVPYTLVLRNATSQQARAWYALLAEFLSGMPTPPAARVRIESCPDIGGPIHKALTLELEKFFAADAFQVLSRSDGADVRFVTPDARWIEPPVP